MTRIPTIKPTQMIAFLRQLGFDQVRQKGSHKFFRHADGRTATVPDHKGEDLGRGITKKILKDVDASEDDLLNWLNRKLHKL